MAYNLWLDHSPHWPTLSEIRLQNAQLFLKDIIRSILKGKSKLSVQELSSIK